MPRLLSPLRRRGLLQGAVGLGVGALLGCRSAPPPTPPAGPARLRLLGEASLSHRPTFRGTTVGGLSGLDFDPATNTWVAICDDRSELQPARFYRLALQFAAGQPLGIELLDVVTLRQAAGTPFPPRRFGGEVVDPEAIRLLPGGQRLLWASEGDPRAGQGPGLREARLDGSHVRDFALPPMLALGPRQGTGPRSNECFEGLALTPDGRSAWAAMEGPLQQDGPAPQVGKPGGPCRFTLFDLASGQATRQIAYQPDAVPRAPKLPGGYADNGVSEILMLDATRMLVMERSYSLGVGTSIRLYEIDTAQASDTLALPTLESGSFRPSPKRPVADFDHLGLTRLDNTEGLCWGPRLPNGRRSLVAVSDDNFNPAQVTQFVAFEFLE